MLDGARVVGLVSIGDLVNWIISAQSSAIRSLAGHIVAGVSTGEEEIDFREFCESLEQQE